MTSEGQAAGNCDCGHAPRSGVSLILQVKIQHCVGSSLNLALVDDLQDVSTHHAAVVQAIISLYTVLNTWVVSDDSLVVKL